MLLVPLLLVAPAGWAAIAVDDFYVVAQDSTDFFFDATHNDQLDTFLSLTSSNFTLIQGQGSISDVDGTAFTPAPGFSGTVVYNYTVTDGSSTSSAQVVFEVQAQSTDFQAVDDLFFVPSSGQAQTVFLNVMANDVQSGSRFGFITDVSPSPTPLGGTVQFGSSSIDYTPPLNVDGLDVFSYTITDSQTGDTSTATVTVQLSASVIEDGGIIQFGSGGTFNGVEGGNALITLTRTSGSLGAVQVEVTAADDGALNGTDYDLPSGTTTVSWADGETGPKVIQIPLIDDGVDESPEQFSLNITNIVGARFTLGSKATVTIADAPIVPDFLERPLPKPEQQKVAGALDQVCADETQTEIDCDALRNLSDADFQNATEQILPRKAVLQAKSVGQVQMGQRINLRGRLKELRTGRNRISVTGLNLNLFGDSVPLARAFQEVINDGLRGGSAGEDNTAARESGDSIADTGKWGLFLTGNVTIGKAEDTDLLVGYDQDGKGITAGIDYRFHDNLIVGGALGYSTDDIEFELNSGEQQTESLSYSFFGNWYPRKELYIDWLLMVTDSELEVERLISIPNANIQGIATSKPESLAWTLASTAGWNWALRNAWQLDAYLRLEYTNTTIDKYREQGGAGFALAVDEQTTDQFDTALGSRVSYTFSWSKGVLVPGLELEWVHVYADNEREITARLIRDPLGTEFSAEDETLDNDYLNASFSLSALFSGGRSGFFRYETVANSEGLDWERYSLGVRWEF